MGNCATSSLLREAYEEEESNKNSSTRFTNKPHSPAHTQLQSSHVYSWPHNLSPLLANIDLLKQSLSKPMNFVHEEPQTTISAELPIQTPIKLPKAAKKVTFAEDLVQTTASNQPVSDVAAMACQQEAHHSFPSRHQREGQMEGLSASLVVKEGAVPLNNNIVKKEVDGVVRLKVVISKKQLSELMCSRSALGKEGGDVLMQKMLAPLLPHLAKSSQVRCSAKSSQPWRPSLDYIPEAYSQELSV